MSVLDDLRALATIADVLTYAGEAPTNAPLPYYVVRPLFIGDGAEGLALSGETLAWDTQLSIYCCGASVAASFNMAENVMRYLDGKRLAGSALTTSMGYIGAQVEGHYESQVTVQLNRGAI